MPEDNPPPKSPPPPPPCIVLLFAFEVPRPENRPDDCGCEVAVEVPKRPPPPEEVLAGCCCCPPNDPNRPVPDGGVLVLLVFPNKLPAGLLCAFEVPRFEKRPPPVLPGALVVGVDEEFPLVKSM